MFTISRPTFVLHMYVLSVEMLHFDGKTQPSPSILGFRLSNPRVYLVEICVYISRVATYLSTSEYLPMYTYHIWLAYIAKYLGIANINRYQKI